MIPNAPGEKSDFGKLKIGVRAVSTRHRAANKAVRIVATTLHSTAEVALMISTLTFIMGI